MVRTLVSLSNGSTGWLQAGRDLVSDAGSAAAGMRQVGGRKTEAGGGLDVTDGRENEVAWTRVGVVEMGQS